MKSISINTSTARNLLISAVAVIALIILLLNSAFTVQYGTVAVLTRFGEIIGDVNTPGLHFKIPLIDQVLRYRTQKVVYETLSVTPYSNASNADYQDVQVDTNTKDGQQVSIRYTVRFAIDPDKIKDVATSLGTEAEVVEKIVKTDSRIWVRQIPRSYSANELYTGNIDIVAEEIAKRLKPIFEKNGLILDEFGIRAIQFTDDYIGAIEQKQIEAEKVKTEEFKAQQEEFKKEALITKAEGESEAQRLQETTLTDNLIKKLYIEKWNGVLPEVSAGSDTGLILDLNSTK
ncbi:prohibitin family protein [Candidatus Nomurabacteria bacterium]|uniref:Prohibitin family protein n=1 Tax=Candidatus Dojkabacteria bacterium TaxID=2099670 RepID=A0A955I303_9BACT|nr:prohibitin family protein [Candidatus Dojkabacteria bacterium]MCB9790271.1 prohibitin family protein [Candidatus Nomurabacteria bacterium]MCB9803208.1 prohibitin family protein [Candidatus Nomurabacteria bacterium]